VNSVTAFVKRGHERLVIGPSDNWNLFTQKRPALVVRIRHFFETPRNIIRTEMGDVELVDTLSCDPEFAFQIVNADVLLWTKLVTNVHKCGTV
jgi:hypothetical protein